MNTKKNKKTDSPHFREFFLDQIKDVYWAEKHLSSGLKKMRKAATWPPHSRNTSRRPQARSNG